MESIEKAIKFLEKSQEKGLPDGKAGGSFLSWTSQNPDDFKNAKKYRSTFPSSLILSCLADAGLPRFSPAGESLAMTQEGLLRFLLSQKSEHWSFNYWARDTRESKEMPYPDDLDDTFCSLAAIYQYQPKIIDGAALAKIVSLLTAVEKEEGGPYRTWIVPETAQEIWKDVDLAVNSNVAYFLSLQDVFLPKIKNFIEEAIDKNNYVSPYYPSAYPIVYFISRWYRGKKKQKIIDFLFKRQDKDGKWENPLNTALAASALLNLGVSAKKIAQAVDYLLKSQQKNGSWVTHAFCIDPAIGGKKYYAGSPALTTAFCAEAIIKLQNDTKYRPSSAVGGRRISNNTLCHISRDCFGQSSRNDKKKEKEIYDNIIEKYRQRFSGFSKDFQKNALEMIEKVLKKNKDIILLPYYFKNALLQKDSDKISDDFVVQLGLANLYGWTAYTIYDDFFDKGGDEESLSLANVCLRASAAIFYNILPDKDYQKICREIFDEIDCANYWETKYCRLKQKGDGFISPEHLPDFKNYTTLAGKSMGHALGPMAIFFALGNSGDSREIKNLSIFFRNYIISRQLNDDAHDFEDDFKKGILTPAVALIIKEWGKNKKDGQIINPKNVLPEFQQIFWEKTIVLLCKDILAAAKSARLALEKIKIIKDKLFLEQMILAQENSARKAISERREAMKFLKIFRSARTPK